jgi:hypothetical protein
MKHKMKKYKKVKKKLHKESVKDFIGAVIDNNFKLANDLLKSVIDQKIKQKIINNNSNIF